ncbi:MAG: NAD(P)H-dependent oxidoreductase [Candidatus Marinimicrobia bacterium]|nr:NAD(P)H-dependent oxidoreductase [bacterium]MCG2715866.1 NAD(P)H-dependent oxidoreductase [Candidatus Neomarinimicrobiota bacterium]
MIKVLIVYWSKSGNTERMAKAVAEGVKKSGEEAVLQRVEETKPEDLSQADGIIIGSPTYCGSMVPQIKELIDSCDKYHGQLKGKVGGAFTSSGNIGGGGETAILSIIHAFLIYGMIVQGNPSYDSGHFGPIAIFSPDERALKECKELGNRVIELIRKLK